MNSESIPLSALDTLKLTNSSLFILNSNVMRHPVFCLAALPLAFHMWFIRAMRLTQDWLYFELCLTQLQLPYIISFIRHNLFMGRGHRDFKAALSLEITYKVKIQKELSNATFLNWIAYPFTVHCAVFLWDFFSLPEATLLYPPCDLSFKKKKHIV